MNKSTLQTNYDSRLFAELYDVQPQAIFWMRPIWNDDVIVDFEYTYFNEEGLRYLNMTREQVTGSRISNISALASPLRQKILDELIHVFTTGKKAENKLYNPTLNKYVSVLRTRLRDGVLSVVQDRTEENGIIQELEAQKKQIERQKSMLEQLMQHSPSSISVLQAIRNEMGEVTDFRNVLVNSQASLFTGISKEDLLSKSNVEIDPGFYGSPAHIILVNTLKTGLPSYTDYQLPTGKWIEGAASKMDADHLICIISDVTASKKIHLQLKQVAEQLQAVFDASQSGMFIFSPVRNEQDEIIDFRFVITNRTFAAYVGQTPEILKGELGSAFFPGYLHNGVFDMYKQTYLTGETLRRDVHYNVDTHDLYLDLMSTKVQNDVLVTFTDYTAVKKAQLQLEKLVEELKRSNESLEEFAHAASHDLKEPIRKIRVFADRLKSSLNNRLTDHEEELFSRIHRATERMTLLVDDLLSYSHLSTTPLQTEEINLNNKLRLVLSDLEVLLEEKKARVEIGELPVINGYRRQMQQLFQNLLTNALKYSKPDVPPVISITASVVDGTDVPIEMPSEKQEKQYNLIEVKDNGIGFEQQYAEKIFQLFQRLHGRSEYSGTGIGLPITRKVVENHGGYIWAESKLGEGAVFKVLLPVL